MILPTTVVFLIFPFTIAIGANQCLDTVRSGRMIQLDGFLMDWPQKCRRPWQGSAVWSWDAVTTREGIAGYFHADTAECSAWTFTVSTGRTSLKQLEIRATAGSNADVSFYRVSSNPAGKKNVITIEWILPWDWVVADSSGVGGIHVGGKSDCADSLEQFCLQSRRHEPPHPFSTGFWVRITGIAALLALFIGLQIRIRRESRRRGSLRQSA